MIVGDGHKVPICSLHPHKLPSARWILLKDVFPSHQGLALTHPPGRSLTHGEPFEVEQTLPRGKNPLQGLIRGTGVPDMKTPDA